MNKTQVVECSERSVYQELNCLLKTLKLDETCDLVTLQRILCERFDGFVTDPVDPTKKWWTTIVPMMEFRGREITYTLKKDDQGFFVVELVAKRQQVSECDTKAEIRKLIRLPIDLEYERIRVLFTVEKCVLVKIPFKFTEEQRFHWMNRFMNVNQFLTTENMQMNQFYKTNPLMNVTTQLLNGWGPVFTSEMMQIQTEIFELLPLFEPFKMIPYFLKEEQAKGYKVILDLVLPMIVRPEEVKVQTLNNERRITFEIVCDRKLLDGKVEGTCQTRRCFTVPRQVLLNQVESKLMPNGHLRFTLPIELKEKILPFEGENIPVRH